MSPTDVPATARRARRAPRPLTSAFEELAAALMPAAPLARIQALWGAAAGPLIAAQATPTAEHDGVLTVTCAASVWAQELALMEPELIERINAELGSETVRELRLRTG